MLPFVEDANETTRFHAVSTVLAQQDANAAKDKLFGAFLEEESVRVRVRLIEGFIQRGWAFDEGADLAGKVPDGYVVNKKGEPRKK